MNPLARVPRRGRQIDRLVARFTGHGTMITSPFQLPRARYTVFVHCDPADAVRAFALADAAGRRWPDWHGLPPPGNVTAPVVQELLRSATYHLVIETATDSCSWDIQVVLNSMQSWAAPPRPWTPAAPPPPAVTVNSDGVTTLVVERTGQYSVDWWLGEPGIRPRVMYPYTLALRAGDGHTLDLGAGDGRRDHRIGSVFLGAGEWVVEMTAQTPWGLSLNPMVGPTGGGSWAF